MFNTAWFDNFGQLGGILMHEHTIDKDRKDMILNSWNEMYRGSGNAGKFALIDGNLKYQQFEPTTNDMQFPELKKENRQRIQAVWGVPDSEIGIYESGMNRATAMQADKNFWQKTLIPRDDTIWEAINVQFIENTKDGSYIGRSDFNKVEALRDDFTEQIDQAGKLVKMRVPPAEAFRITGVPVEINDQRQLETSFMPWTLVEANSAVGQTIEDVKPKPAAPSTPADDDKKKGESKKSVDPIGDAVHQEIRFLKSDNYILRVLNPGEKTLTRSFQGIFNSLRNEMLDNIDKWYKENKNEQLDFKIRVLILDPKQFLYDKKAADEEIVEAMRPIVKSQMNRATSKVSEEIGGLVNWAVNEETIESYIGRRTKFYEKINTTNFNNHRKMIANRVTEAVRENKTVNELALSLRDGVKEESAKSLKRSGTIARTEVGSISSNTRHAAFKVEGIKNIEWLSSRDERVRVPGKNNVYDHAIDGEIVGIGDTFSNGLHFPHDPTGQPGNVINCRCVELAVMK